MKLQTIVKILRKAYTSTPLIIILSTSTLFQYDSCIGAPLATKPTPEKQRTPALRLATTTSLDNTGLLAELLPKFTKDTGIKIKAIAVGTGEAIRLAREGDVDLIFVHHPESEKALLKAGFGINRKSVMYNDFVVVCPKSDPANIHSASNITEALRRISSSQQPFVSRSDNSGTAMIEKSLWHKAGISPNVLSGKPKCEQTYPSSLEFPRGGNTIATGVYNPIHDCRERRCQQSGKPKCEGYSNWYKEVGQGMASTLLFADTQNAYTLADRATFLVLQNKLQLKICYQGGQQLKNIYSVIAVNPQKYRDINYADSKKFINWLNTNDAKMIINGFQKTDIKLFHLCTKQQCS